MKSYFNQPSSSSKKGPEEDEEDTETVVMPSHFNGRVGIAAMARKLSNRVSNLCSGAAAGVHQTFDGQGSTFDRREIRGGHQSSVVMGGKGGGDLENENKTLKNEISDL